MTERRLVLIAVALLLAGLGLFLLSRPAGEGPEPPAPAPADPEVAERERRLTAALDADGETHRLGEATTALLDDFARRGVDVAALLARERAKAPLGRATKVGRDSAIFQALERIGTPAAKAALLEAAHDARPGSDSPTLGPRAAASYAALAKGDSAEIARLIDSAEPAARDAAAQALAGLELAPAATVALGRLLESTSWVTHNLVAAAFATDRSPATAAAKVDLLLAASGRIAGLPDVPGLLAETGLNAREVALGAYLHALAVMPGADEPLAGRRASATGLARTLVGLALARRGRAEVRDEVLAAIRTAQDGHLRLLAVESLRPIATRDDLPLLRTLAGSDPFEREVQHPGPPRRVFFVRDAAASVMSTIEAPK